MMPPLPLRYLNLQRGGIVISNFWSGTFKLTGGIVTALVFCSNSAVAGESLETLKSRIKINIVNEGIMRGDPSLLTTIPVKGYKDGIAGFMRKFNLYPHPDNSFTECGGPILATGADGKTGCIISIKLASKNEDGSFRDRGVRLEYGVAVGTNVFRSNNSVYAEHAIKGDGFLEAQFR